MPGQARRSRHLFGGRLDQRDHDALDVLIDQDHPWGIMQRTDMFLHASRHVSMAKDAGNQRGA